MFLGVGNVYRTMAWPKGAGPMRLGAIINLAAVPPLLPSGLAVGGLDLAPLAHVPGLVAAQLAASTVMYLTFFRLQAVGGPTYLSQIGYVAAAVGVAIGVSFLGERYPPLVWAGIAVVAAGIGLTTWRRRGRPSGGPSPADCVCFLHWHTENPSAIDRAHCNGPGVLLVRGRGEIGRHAGFRFLWGNPWGFKSLRPHQARAET